VDGGRHPLLALFDIDGTLLLKAFVEHRDALHTAIRRVYHVDIPDGHIEAAGRTDVAIARSLLTLAGVDDELITRRVDELRAAACEEYARRAPADLSARIAPGVRELLHALEARGDVRLSLVTGNLEPIARLKLTRAGIGHYFARGQGGFGSDSEDRAGLPPLARRRAGDGRMPWPRERTVVIGDTPRDIACARADGVRCVAVTTGPFAAAQLAQADAVVPGARETLGVLEEMAAG
jgi:phosphoglycolate phosphatase-like HAD superfamily hydrolase